MIARRRSICPGCGGIFNVDRPGGGKRCPNGCGYSGIRIAVDGYPKYPSRISAASAWAVEMWRLDKNKGMIQAIDYNERFATVILKAGADGNFPFIDGEPNIVKYVRKA